MSTQFYDHSIDDDETHDEDEDAQAIVPDLGIELDPSQVRAIELCVSPDNRIVGVTGAAGTGKTTTMRYVHQALVHAGYSVALCSPTGKATKRIREATGLPALTIHKLLEFGQPDQDEDTGKAVGVSLPSRNNGRPLEHDVIIADEYSMVNRGIHGALIQALKPGARLLAFGDTNQLRPIEEGVELSDKTKKETPFEALLRKFPSVMLDVVHRQGTESGIIANAHRVLKRMAPKRYDDFELHVTDMQVNTIARIAGGDREWAGLNRQIITPMNKGMYGTHALNSMLQTLYEPDVTMPHVTPKRYKWEEKLPIRLRVGTKVIHTKNNYDLGVFNGETGIVVACDMTRQEFVVDFGDRHVHYPYSIEKEMLQYGKVRKITYYPQRDVQLAYCITTHKAQGSEFHTVMYVMSNSMWFGQNRANLYTGITRAKQHVLLVTDSASLVRVPLKEE